MTIQKIGEVSPKCLFCGSVLRGINGEKPQSGDLIRCLDCGEENDYDSVLDVAKETARNMAIESANKMIKDLFKK